MSKEKQMGMVSEEALDEIAGGLNISKDKVKKVLIGAGVGIGIIGGLGAAGYAGYKGAEMIHGAIDKHNMAKENSINNIAPDYFEPVSSKKSHKERYREREERLNNPEIYSEEAWHEVDF